MTEPGEPEGNGTPAVHYLKAELYEHIRSSDQIFEFLQRGSLDGIWYWDIENPEHEWMSDSFWETLGYDPAEKKPLASEWQDLIFEDDLKLATENFEKHCADPKHAYDQVVRYTCKDGSTAWIRCRGIAIRDAEGRALRMLGAHNDLTPMKRMEEELRIANERLSELARQDPLTNIPNRRFFDEQLPIHASIGSRADSTLALLLIDIDRFKHINDTHGHPAGDAVVRDVAQILTRELREGDLCCRIGGDEFAIVAHAAKQGSVASIAERVRRGIATASMTQESVTVSIGVCVMPERKRDNMTACTGQQIADAMYESADRMLYDAKQRGRNCYVLSVLDYDALSSSAVDPSAVI